MKNKQIYNDYMILINKVYSQGKTEVKEIKINSLKDELQYTGLMAVICGSAEELFYQKYSIKDDCRHVYEAMQHLYNASSAESCTKELSLTYL